jgi:hypothetical protein
MPCWQKFCSDYLTMPSPDCSTSSSRFSWSRRFSGNLALASQLPGIVLTVQYPAKAPSFVRQLATIGLLRALLGFAASCHLPHPSHLLVSLKATLAQLHRDTAEAAHLWQPIVARPDRAKVSACPLPIRTAANQRAGRSYQPSNLRFENGANANSPPAKTDSQ